MLFFLYRCTLYNEGIAAILCFFEDEDYTVYLGYLDKAVQSYGCALHAYVLMTNYVHLLVTPEGMGSATRMMQKVGRDYVPFINHKYGRSGTLWEGR